MVRLVAIILLFLLSLLCVFKAPAYYLWYVAILVSEFSVIFIGIAVLLLIWGFKVVEYKIIGNIFCGISIILLMIPIAGARKASSNLDKNFEASFGKGGSSLPYSNTIPPFSFWRLFMGLSSDKNQVSGRPLVYSSGKDGTLTLDFYASGAKEKRPCVVVVHGGSWSGGDSKQLPDLNSYLCHSGYHVASINYRLAPQFTSPAQIEDVRNALNYLKQNADSLNIDTNNFVLLGRSAGGQIVLTAGYTLHEPGIKGVINFYGPTDMVWGYAHPANPWVLNTCKVMEDYPGGTYSQAPQNYLRASATETVVAGSVPTLLIHGQNDPLVAWEHEPRLVKKLQEHGVKYFLLTLPWATHGCDYSLYSPSGQLCTYTIERFLNVVTKE